MNKKLVKTALPLLAFLFIFSISVATAREKSPLAPTATSEQTTETTTQSSTNDSNGYQKAKTEWQNKLKEMKAKKQTVTEEVKKANLEKAKTMVSKAIDRAIFRLERIKTRISKIKVITDGRKTKLIAQLDEQITALNTLKEKVSAVTTKEELKTAVGEVKNKFVEIRSIVKKIVAEILASHIDKTITKLTTITTKLEIEIANLKTQGQDVATMEKTLNEAKTLLTQATNKNTAGEYKEARKLAEQARAKLAKLAGEIKSSKAKIKGGINETE